MAIINTGDFPIDPTTTTGTDLADRLNRLMAALESSHANTTRPAYLTAGAVWTQPQAGGGYKLFFYDGARDHQIGSVDAAGTAQFGGGTALAPEFSATATYATGAIIHDKASNAYLQAKNAVAAGPYNPDDWQPLTDVLGSLNVDLSVFVKKAGDTMAGALHLPSLTVNNIPVLAGPAFCAYPNAQCSGVTSSTFTKISFNTEEFDTANCYDTALSRFTPNVKGYYQVNAACQMAGSPSITSAFITLYKNGVRFRDGALLQNGAGVGNMSPVFSAVIYFNGTTDYVEMYGSITGTGALNFASGPNAVHFSASMVRGA